MMFSEKPLPDAVDLRHHLSELAKARSVSPLKGLQKYMDKPGLISLAGGLPSPQYFPFHSLGAEVLVEDQFPLNPSSHPSSLSWFWKLFGSKPAERTTSVSVPKFADKTGDIDLATALQYSMAKGLQPLQDFIKKFVENVYQPAYGNYVTLIHAGNTDGVNKSIMTLCNPGDGVLMSEWTYPSTMATIKPLGVDVVPVGMDGQGMSAIALEQLLAEWDVEAHGGMARPRVMYTVPIGQNPTGATMGAQRKKEIYAVCVKYDVVIIEDDPYYFLQQGEYVPKAERVEEDVVVHKDEEKHFVASLAPSFLKFDYQGRVIRLETFSKTIAPGSRLGFFTCNPMFAERLERQGETSTQAPCGFGQSMVASLLLQWQYPGYIRWLRALRLQYKARRDFFIDCFDEQFSMRRSIAASGAHTGAVVYEGSLKPLRGEKFAASGKTLFSFIPPSSGMFIWMQLHFDDHPELATLGTKELEMKLWTALAEAGVMFGPGAMFSSVNIAEDAGGPGHFRISFSNAEYDELKKSVEIFQTVIRKFFKDL
ncbi:pyridoxal phosphate-dependent transferase [Schizophyllum amplum]|uniref:Pyridoxal phosphate-dependent transferase n=1 Tax=Schizophyllum amplum TaxID=97359 RepID=A0A550CTH3_9AGAR|nr:pyridoxal phosphate-dependent transferase [Auriculariopsis ampla]